MDTAKTRAYVDQVCSELQVQLFDARAAIREFPDAEGFVNAATNAEHNMAHMRRYFEALEENSLRQSPEDKVQDLVAAAERIGEVRAVISMLTGPALQLLTPCEAALG